MIQSIAIAAGTGTALPLARRAQLRVILSEGPQVVDLWAFATDDPAEHLSMAHSRSCLDKLCAGVGEAMVSNRRRPMLTLVADTSPGVHDTLLSACDAERYRLLGHRGPHATCADNLRAALGAHGRIVDHLPSPWNLFENVAAAADGRLTIEAPVAKTGDAVTLRAEMDLVVVLSACPMDIAATNGGIPKGVTVELSDHTAR